MKKKNIRIGDVQIADWDPKDGRMFQDWYYDEDATFFEEGEREAAIKKCDPNEVILPPNQEYTLIIDYPVSTEYKAKLKTGVKGMTRIQFADKVCKHYRKMYDEEDRTAGKKTGNIPGMMNRSTSEGKYGIWGHCIGDLMLVSATVFPNGNIKLGVDS